MAMQNITLDNVERGLELRVGKTCIVHGFVSKQGVANFLGVPFARVPARFRTAQRTNLEHLSGIADATQYGPRCPQPVDHLHCMLKDVFEKLSSDQRYDEFSCLHLNIYTPPTGLGESNGNKLPVLVWLHGGSFNNGDNTTEFDGNHLVQRSVELDKPIIVVAVNYRLNLLGFSASKELVDEAEALGETPILNQGLNDQRLGLEWIQSSIHHFGGDASNVALSGESAGAVSVLCHLQGGKPLFQRAVIHSSPLPRLRRLEDGQASFDRLVSLAGIPADASGADKLAALRALPVERIVGFFDGSISMPFEDPGWFVSPVSPAGASYWGRMPDWCSKVVLGHLKDEAALFFLSSAEIAPAQVLRSLQSILPDSCFEEELARDKPDLPALVARVTDEMFARPALELASHMSQGSASVYVYRTDVVDPFPGPLHGYAWHSFGVPLFFYQPPGRAWPQIRASQEKMSVSYMDFLHGVEPWERYNVAQRRMCWDGEQTRLVDCAISDT